MSSSNSCHFIGNLTKDPVLNQTPNGISKCTFTIAVNRRFADKDGVRKADFIPITAWRGLAENCGKYLTKGRRVAIEARVQTDSYTTESGETRYSTFFIADDVEFQPAGQGNHDTKPEAPAVEHGTIVSTDEDELPF